MIFWPQPDILNHVQRDEGFAGIREIVITIGGRGGKNCFWIIYLKQ